MQLVAMQFEGGCNGAFALGALGLGSAWMLLWGAAAAIPIVLHLLNRRRQRSVTWAAMQLLLQVVEQESRRVRIEQILLLVLRTLIPLFLAYALARPYFSGNESEAATNADVRPKLWIVAIDVSYSMGYHVGEQTRFASAKERALELIRDSSPGDAYALIALSSQPTKVISRPTFDREGMLTEIRRLELLDTGLQLGSGLQLIEDIAEDAKRSTSLPRDVQAVILSDLGIDAWQSATTGEVQKQLRRIGESMALQIVPPADDGPPLNAAVVALQPTVLRPIVGAGLDVDVTVENFGTAGLDRLPVQLKIDEQTVASEFVDIPAGAARTIRLTCMPGSSGPTVLSASIPPDRLTADDRRHRVLEVTAQHRVLIVEEQSGQGRALAVALSSSAESARRTQVVIRPRLELSGIQPADWDVIVLYDVAQLERNHYDRLLLFARAGGSLVLMLGPNTLAENWNALQTADTAPAGWLLGFQLLQPSEEQLWEIDALDYASPIVEPFRGFPDAGLLTTPIFRFWRLQPMDNESLIVDLATSTGEPLLVRHRQGSGWVACLLSAPQSGSEAGRATTGWNAMAAWPSFVPLMQRLVQTVLTSGTDEYNLLAGQPLVGRVTGAVETSQVTIQRPDGLEEIILTDQVEPDGKLPWLYPRTQRRGLYLARAAGIREQAYAVNINPVESGLVSLPLSQLPGVSNKAPQPQAAATEPIVPRNHGDQLARWILAGLAALLVSESLVAWWFGRRVG